MTRPHPQPLNLRPSLHTSAQVDVRGRVGAEEIEVGVDGWRITRL